MADNQFCPQCGGRLKPNAKFCAECGVQIESSFEAPPVNQQPIPTPVDATINYGSDNNNNYNPNYVTPTGTATSTPAKQNPIAISSIVLAAVSFALFFTNYTIFIWFSLAFAILGILVGIGAIFYHHKKELGIIGIILNVVVIAVWISINLGWF
ncbi:MAG: hypothetical protein FK734_02730 [Asgard group archaeon]|nr:hypothetical protein [Asgard group archaeon]